MSTSGKDLKLPKSLPPYGDYQNEIYLAGLEGVLPQFPVDYRTLEARAAGTLPASILSYVQSGCGDGTTQIRNVEAFGHWGMTPRMMVDSSKRDLSIELFGLKLPSPLFMAPIGMTGMCTQDSHGDLAAARASVLTRVPMMATTLSNDPLETVAATLGDMPGFFQLYCPKDKEFAESLIQRAETAGFKGIVVSLDAWDTGWRPHDLATANFPQLRGHVLANYTSDPVFQKMLGKAPVTDTKAVVQLWYAREGKVLTWADMPWLRSITKLPLILKGICHADDARRAIDSGADAVYCSNHGGRQANGGRAAIDMLPAVVAASGDTPVLFDSGVRSGTDVVKALALGARAVGVGRPYVYGLALGGDVGAAHVIKCLLAEADLLMALNGYPTISDVRAAGVTRQ
jgi:lactate 2-monooxygenase